MGVGEIPPRDAKEHICVNVNISDGSAQVPCLTTTSHGSSGWNVDTESRNQPPTLPSKSLLLNLPMEIRDMIIKLVLYSCRNPPASPSKTDRVDFYDMKYMAWRRRKEEIWNEQGSTPNSLSLLLTNRQLSDETQRLIERFKRANSSDYVIDISILDENSLYPTWLSVPWLTESVNTLHVDVRLFGSIITRSGCIGISGDGGRFGVHWSFLAVLERFLRYGPVGLKKDKENGEDRKITIQNLVFNFRSVETKLAFPPDTVTYRQWLQVRHMNRRQYERRYGASPDISDFATKPEWIARYLTEEIHGLLSLGFHHRSYGEILFERIGTIRFLLDGKLQLEDNLSSILASRKPETLDFGTILWHERNSDYREWWPATIAQREKQGFPPPVEPASASE